MDYSSRWLIDVVDGLDLGMDVDPFYLDRHWGTFRDVDED